MDIRREIEIGIENGDTMAMISRRLNMSFSTFKREATKLGLYYTNQGRKGIERSKEERDSKRISISLILNGDHKMRSYALKMRLIEEGIKKEICEECGVGKIWNDRELNLHLDHADGDSSNNKIENLRMLCPNCHSQTETYAGRNVRLKNIKNGKKYDVNFKNIKGNWYLDQEKYIDLILKSEIDFSKLGWVTKVSKIINQPHQKVGTWMMKMMPDFYKKCYKRAEMVER